MSIDKQMQEVLVGLGTAIRNIRKGYDPLTIHLESPAVQLPEHPYPEQRVTWRQDKREVQQQYAAWTCLPITEKVVCLRHDLEWIKAGVRGVDAETHRLSQDFFRLRLDMKAWRRHLMLLSILGLLLTLKVLVWT